MDKFLCGAPKDRCTGGLTTTSHGLHDSIKAHSSHLEAFKCFRAYLLKSGYMQIGPREFKSPDDGTVLILDKKSKFGGRLRPGKSEKTSRNARYMPERGGLIY